MKRFTDEIRLTATAYNKDDSRITYELTSDTMVTVSRFICENAVQGSCLFPRLRFLVANSMVDSYWVPKYLLYLSPDTLQSLTFGGGPRLSMKKMNKDVHAGWQEIMPHLCSAWPNLRSLALYSPTSLSSLHEPGTELYSQVFAPWFQSLVRLENLTAQLAPHPSLLHAQIGRAHV